MPTISRFYGLMIRMFYNDHAPPHFHAAYGDHEAVIGISPVVVLAGELPVRAQNMAIEWAELHQTELLENWGRCRDGRSPCPVAPLE